MFFKTKNLTSELLSVIELEWEKINAKAEFRPFHCISFRLAGDSTFFTDVQSPLKVKKEEIVFVPAKYDFSKQGEHGKIIAIHFFSNNDLPTEILRFKPLNPLFFKAKFTELLNVWQKKHPYYEYEAKLIFYQIVLEMEHEWGMARPFVSNSKLSEALNYIHEHFNDKKISIDFLAKMCGMSDTYFRNLFVSEFGITPLRYINNLRMTQIREILQSSNYSIEEVAEQCSFNTINYFSTFVKKETGLSPSAYRQHLLESKDP